MTFGRFNELCKLRELPLTKEGQVPYIPLSLGMECSRMRDFMVKIPQSGTISN